MNGNWNGLLGTRRSGCVEGALRHHREEFRQVQGRRRRPRSGIRFSLRAPVFSGSAARFRITIITKPDDVNGGVNHFGSPFNFPEEFVTVYRLHALIPDLIEYPPIDKDPNQIVAEGCR